MFYRQMLFNAGQLLFRVSERMKAHFDNVNWFMLNYTGEYFFEQAFMNYYFCKGYLTEDTKLQKYMAVISTVDRLEYKMEEHVCLAHFIAPPLDAKTKLLFIEDFLNNRDNVPSDFSI